MNPLLQVEQLSKVFSMGRGKSLTALDEVSFHIEKGETLGIVGESGCGKSTLARVIMGAYTPSKGKVLYGGEPVMLRSVAQRRAFAKKAQMVFQDPYTSLDPYLSAMELIEEGLEIHGLYDKQGRKDRVYQLLELVGLAKEQAGRYPHEFSGGQRQRIGIARALAVEPEFLLCDEPISALDVSIQSQIVNLLQRLRKELGLTMLFIAHDLNMVRYLSDRIAVLYLGRIVELAPAEELCLRPRHPYTKLLLSSVLSPSPRENKLAQAEKMPDMAGKNRPAKGCVFAGRCPYVQSGCMELTPTLKEEAAGHFTACVLEKVTNRET